MIVWVFFKLMIMSGDKIVEFFFLFVIGEFLKIYIFVFSFFNIGKE